MNWGSYVNYMQDCGQPAKGAPRRKAELDLVLFFPFPFYVTRILRKLGVGVLGSNVGQNIKILFMGQGQCSGQLDIGHEIAQRIQ